MRQSLLFLAAALLSLSALAEEKTTLGDCRIGAYRLGDGGLVDIGPSTGDTFRWRRFDGTTGQLHPGADQRWSSTRGWSAKPDGTQVSFSDCAAGQLAFNGASGHRIAFDVTETSFQGADVTLAGRLVLPQGKGPAPIVVLIHGSEDYSARDFYSLQRILPAEGVGVFVYDKRGTSGSSGKYTQDFELLAQDAAAALKEARRLAGPRAGRVGFQGSSQGGWIAPLAATKAHADFVIVAYGLAVSPLEEDREEVALEMALAGHSREETAAALAVAEAAESIVTSGLTDGYGEFDALRAKYRDKPWYKDLHGNFTFMLLPLSEAEIRAQSDKLAMGTPWYYDGMGVLETLNTPEIWILGDDDLAAPSAETSRRLRDLIAQGRPITLAMFSKAEHGLYEYELNAEGERDDMRNVEGYFAMMRDFARDGTLTGTYGRARITPAKP